MSTARISAPARLTRPPLSPLQRTTLIFVAIGAVCLATADVSVTTVNPWQELGRLALGLVTPDFLATERLLEAIAYTLAFAFLGVALANVVGFGLGLAFHRRGVRVACATLRAVHELFWALLFLQFFGLSPLTGLLAIAVPYSGIIAKVYAEILEEGDRGAERALPAGTGRLSALLYARLPAAWAHFKTYSMYRLECGLRSSAVLGFVGLPTLGYHLESAFSQGAYSQVWALLILFYVAIATIRFWMRRPLLPVYLIGALALLPWGTQIDGQNIVRFFTQDIVPYPLRAAETLDAAALGAFGGWLWDIVTRQALPGLLGTVELTMMALVVTGVLALVWFPLISPLFFKGPQRIPGHVALVVLRSTPEYILAYVGLQLWGPSMLPALVALSLHNGGIVGHLVGRYTEQMKLRVDAPRGLNLYFYEAVPRVFRQLLAFLFYRWEIIMRETAILGMLGIATLGFFVDSAFAEIRYDRAVVLIAVVAALNVGVDAVSRRIREGLRLETRAEYA
jgi:phosphonate transport system permease protein